MEEDPKTQGHKRSKSDSAMKKIQENKFSRILATSYHPKLDMEEPEGCVKGKMRQSPGTGVQNSLKQEILHLQKQLEDQFVVRSALTKALTNRPLSYDPTNENSVTKPAEDLIKEIAVLELEVVYLERYLLSLYRRTFDERVSFLSTVDEKSKSKSAAHDWMLSEVSGANTIVDSGIHRSHSSLSQRSAHSFRTSPPMGTLAEAVQSYHSLPLSMLQHAQVSASNVASLAEHLGASIFDHIQETPNWISEEMIKCISAIYSELADPPLINHSFPSSPISLSSSIGDSSPQCQYDTCNPDARKNSSFHLWTDNPFSVEGSKEFSGSYSTMIEVQWICRDSQRLRRVKHMLQNFRSLVSRLEKVDPKKMKHGEKLAFWINIHNALAMHAFLVYGIPHNNLKRISLLLKAAYNVGGHTISVNMIQNSILGCRLPRPGQWLQSLFFPKTKFKVRDARKVYAIEHPEPRVYFALSSGSHSDPVVRMYTPKWVFQELEAAKEDYIHTAIRVHKEQKIILPKIVDSFAKESDLCPAGLMELIEHFMSDSLRKRSDHQHQRGKCWKRIDWMPHNFTFRYLISKDLAK
ncbi:unnamed protein product [Camellia sinensis]